MPPRNIALEEHRAEERRLAHAPEEHRPARARHTPACLTGATLRICQPRSNSWCVSLTLPERCCAYWEISALRQYTYKAGRSDALAFELSLCLASVWGGVCGFVLRCFVCGLVCVCCVCFVRVAIKHGDTGRVHFGSVAMQVAKLSTRTCLLLQTELIPIVACSARAGG